MGDEKKERPAHPHTGHRERVRNLFLKSGLDGFSDHNVLELLLFYTIPKSDTNIIAHNLIDRFGTLRNVLNASPEELRAVKGMGMYTATFLSILPQLARRYCADEMQAEQTFGKDDSEALCRYLQSVFVGEQSECVYLVSFGSGGQKISCIKVTSGSTARVLFEERMLLEAAFRTNAVSVVIAHNHPGGVAAPSLEDVETTKRLVSIFRQCSISLVDHIIVAGQESFSMVSHTKYRPIFVG